MELVLGIALRDEYLCAAYIGDSGQIKYVTTETKSRMLPNAVAFTPHGVLIGQAALDQASSNAENTVKDITELLGKTWDGVSCLADARKWPFKVFAGKDDEGLLIEVSLEHQVVRKSVLALQTYTLKRLKELAEQQSRWRIKAAVLVLPTEFTATQKRMAQAASINAGFPKVIQLELPLAVVRAYCFEYYNHVQNADLNVLFKEVNLDDTYEHLIRVTGQEYEEINVERIQQLSNRRESISDFDMWVSRTLTGRDSADLVIECSQARLALGGGGATTFELKGTAKCITRDLLAKALEDDSAKHFEFLLTKKNWDALLVGGLIAWTTGDAFQLYHGNKFCVNIHSASVVGAALFGAQQLKEGRFDDDVTKTESDRENMKTVGSSPEAPGPSAPLIQPSTMDTNLPPDRSLRTHVYNCCNNCNFNLNLVEWCGLNWCSGIEEILGCFSCCRQQ